MCLVHWATGLKISSQIFVAGQSYTDLKSCCITLQLTVVFCIFPNYILTFRVQAHRGCGHFALLFAYCTDCRQESDSFFICLFQKIASVLDKVDIFVWEFHLLLPLEWNLIWLLNEWNSSLDYVPPWVKVLNASVCVPVVLSHDMVLNFVCIARLSHLCLCSGAF